MKDKEFDLQGAFDAKMAESKIDSATAKKLKLAPTTTEKAPKGLPYVEPGIVIPYFDLEGRPTKFWRYRYLRQPKVTGFAAAVKRKPLKYVQPEKTLNELYLPPIINWKEVAKDPLTPILITEGEFKSISACLHGEYPCIGLGGVWSWKSAKKKIDMIDGFDDFVWEQRPVYIVYDSDAVTNPMVMQAENALARALTNRGAEPHIVRLPMGADNAKMGLDDFIVQKGIDALDILLEQAEVWATAIELHKLNEEVVYVRDPGLILRMDNLQRMSTQAFWQHAFSTRTYVEEVPNAKGVTRQKKIAPKEWLAWPSRAEVPRVTYAPGEERITEQRELNIWPGWGVEPVEGDITPWRELLDYLFKGKPREREWFERWCAWPLQNPGAKMFTSCLVWGLHHGTGKSLVGYTLGKIYGKNFTEVDDEILRSSHNEWAENKQFVMGDEISTNDKRAVSDRMKTMITRQQLRLNPKYIPSYTVQDVINYYFTSNHPDAFFLEDDDRRFFVHEVIGKPLPDEFYKKYQAWLAHGGASALFYHLLMLDMGDFNAASRALMTAAKQEMMQQSRSDLGSWVAALKDDPDTVLRAAGHPVRHRVWRAEDLLAIYDPEGKGRVTANGMARELSRQGFNKCDHGNGIRTMAGQCRLWAIRDVEEVLKLSGPAVGELYNKERNLKGSPAPKAEPTAKKSTRTKK